jgi:hypothetical protein
VNLAGVFDRSKQAYRAYIGGGRTFGLAKAIHAANSEACGMLSAMQLPAGLEADRQALLAHYKAWFAGWDAEIANRPGNDDVFAFDNVVIFPKDSESRILEFLR